MKFLRSNNVAPTSRRGFNFLASLRRDLLDFLFPVECVGCGTQKTHCCRLCWEKISDHKPLIQKTPNADKPALEGIIYSTIHQEKSPLAHLIHRFKYDGAQEIGKLLAQLFKNGKPPKINFIFIPVPLHKRRLRFRGFNQSKILAMEIAKYWDGNVQEILKRHRYTPPQVELSRDERLKNVRGAFSLAHDAHINPQTTYFLVDDVCTTGTTLSECARILRQYGAEKIYGLVVART